MSFVYLGGLGLENMYNIFYDKITSTHLFPISEVFFIPLFKRNLSSNIYKQTIPFLYRKECIGIEIK